jgi:hypothetical protein
VVDAWLSHGAPFQQLAAFDELRVYTTLKTNMFPKPGASVQMELEFVLLCQK